ncbi:MAG: tetratricopeptide repeat protein [Syntrophaceae bacterium]|nr:tetratricopeptide repeat protein [Syntrophaceae bacterium]
MATKINKRELEEPDKLQRFFIALKTFLEVYRKRVLTVAGLLVVVLILFGGWLLYDRYYEGKAQDQYNQVLDAKLRTDPELAESDRVVIDGFKDVIALHPRTNAAHMAKYKLANLYATRKEYDLAIPTYEAFLAKRRGNGDLTSLAHAGLGSCLEAKKDYDKALNQFELAWQTNKTRSLAGLHLSNIARIYELLNNIDKATEFYKQALEKTHDPVLEFYLKRKLALLG